MGIGVPSHHQHVTIAKAAKVNRLTGLCIRVQLALISRRVSSLSRCDTLIKASRDAGQSKQVWQSLHPTKRAVEAANRTHSAYRYRDGPIAKLKLEKRPHVLPLAFLSRCCVRGGVSVRHSSGH